jgi:hypothetical protein
VLLGTVPGISDQYSITAPATVIRPMTE